MRNRAWWAIACLGWAGCGWPIQPSPRRGDGPATSSGASLVVLPDDGPRQLLDALAGSRRRAWIEMYLLTDGDAVDALVAAHRAGADVRILLEPTPYGGGDNAPAFLALQQAGVDVRWFSVPEGLVHIKLLLLDDVAWILTPNLTTAGLTRNREYAVADDAPADVARAEAVFMADLYGQQPPQEGGSRVLVSPLDARSRLVAAIEASRRTLALEIEELSDTDVVGGLVAAHGRGVAVSVLVPATERSAATDAAVIALQSAGLAVRAIPSPTVHAKAMVVDGSTAYVGSVNFTRASLDDNREMGVLVEDPALVSRVGATMAADWASAPPSAP